jgi:hypothetical protein
MKRKMKTYVENINEEKIQMKGKKERQKRQFDKY